MKERKMPYTGDINKEGMVEDELMETKHAPLIDVRYIPGHETICFTCDAGYPLVQMRLTCAQLLHFAELIKNKTEQNVKMIGDKNGTNR